MMTEARSGATPDEPTTITYLCERGEHGTAERRSAYDANGKLMFKEMWTGRCAGTVFDIHTGREANCECRCHTPTDAQSTIESQS